MVLISACLAGEKCRYDGSAKPNAALLERLGGDGAYMPVCPECLGGLEIPRQPAEIVGGDGAAVLDGRANILGRDGADRTEAFLRGAEATLRLAMENNVKRVYLKQKSPSCGAGEIYDGTFSGRCIPGDGVTAALLRRNGIEIVPV